MAEGGSRAAGGEIQAAGELEPFVDPMEESRCEGISGSCGSGDETRWNKERWLDHGVPRVGHGNRTMGRVDGHGGSHAQGKDVRSRGCEGLRLIGRKESA